MITIGDDDDRPRKSTGDPELDALWRMSFRDLQRIVEDDDDPRQDKARQVLTDAFAPLKKSLDNTISPALKELAIQFGSPPKLPPGMVATLDEFAKRTEMLSNDYLNTVARNVLRQSVIRAPRDAIEVDLREPIDEGVSADEVHEAAEGAASAVAEIERDFYTQLIAQGEAKAALDHDQHAYIRRRDGLLDKRHLDTQKQNRVAIWFSGVAAVASVVGLILTVVLRPS